jgi:hypothetical protein
MTQGKEFFEVEDRRKGGGDHHVKVGALPPALEDDTTIE